MKLTAIRQTYLYENRVSTITKNTTTIPEGSVISVTLPEFTSESEYMSTMVDGKLRFAPKRNFVLDGAETLVESLHLMKEISAVEDSKNMCFFKNNDIDTGYIIKGDTFPFPIGKELERRMMVSLIRDVVKERKITNYYVKTRIDPVFGRGYVLCEDASKTELFSTNLMSLFQNVFDEDF